MAVGEAARGEVAGALPQACIATIQMPNATVVATMVGARRLVRAPPAIGLSRWSRPAGGMKTASLAAI